MKDFIGKSVIVAVLLFAATAAMAMDPAKIILFWGGGQQPLSGPGFPYTFPITLE